jgi:hypothetical protein
MLWEGCCLRRQRVSTHEGDYVLRYLFPLVFLEEVAGVVNGYLWLAGGGRDGGAKSSLATAGYCISGVSPAPSSM